MTTVLFVNIFASEHRDISGLGNIPLLEDTHNLHSKFIKNFENCETKNILDRHISNNDRGYIVEHCKTEQLKHSFFVRTVVEWNHLNTATVRTETVESFKQALPQCY